MAVLGIFNINTVMIKNYACQEIFRRVRELGAQNALNSMHFVWELMKVLFLSCYYFEKKYFYRIYFKLLR